MKTVFVNAAAAAALAGLTAIATPAEGAQRTFVASTGSDANACTLAAPCRSFATAMSHTDPGGTVAVLDSAGYGITTIAQSVSIIAPPGVYAGISVFSGQDGITVGGPGIVVTLRGLSIEGQGGNRGIVFTNGAELVIEHCTIVGTLQEGILASAPGSVLRIADTSVRDTGGFAGIQIAGTTSFAIVRAVSQRNAGGVDIVDGPVGTIVDSEFTDNVSFGIAVYANGATTQRVAAERVVVSANGSGGVVVNAIAAGTVSSLRLVNAVVSGNKSHGIAICCAGMSGAIDASVANSTVSSNAGNGIIASGPAAFVTTLASNRIEGNVQYGIRQASSAVVNTRQDNVVAGNGTGNLSGVLTSLTPL